jgi:polyhydroxyalkanoate synthesis regulator phasin
MKTTDLFAFSRSSKRLNESLAKTFGRKLNLETFSVEQLEDARNKLRTQIYTARSSSNFNETVENDTLSKAQFMHDAIVAELAERDEPIVDNTVYEGLSPEVEEFLTKVANDPQAGYDMLYDAQMGKFGKEIERVIQDMYDDVTIDTGYHGDDDFEQIYDRMLDNIEADYGDRGSDDEGGDTDDAYAMASAGHGSDEDYGTFDQGENVQIELSTNTLKSYQDKAGKDIVNTMTSGDHMTTDKSAKKVMNRMRGSEKADNKIYKKENESIEQTGEDMRNLREGEIQQASAIVTAKTMVDRVGRWIEELSGMENDTLLQLGDSIRDEMSQEQAKAFIEAVAPAIQQALETLKSTRDTLSSGVRSLASGEQPTDMLGAEPGADMAAPAEPDAMNAEPGMDVGDEVAGDDFDAAEPAAGGIGDAGREQRESIDRQSRLMKVLAG